MQLAIQGSQNSSLFFGECKGSYKSGGTRSPTSEYVMLQITSSSQNQVKHGHILGTITDRKLAVDFSQYPDYNTLFIWKSQVSFQTLCRLSYCCKMLSPHFRKCKSNIWSDFWLNSLIFPRYTVPEKRFDIENTCLLGYARCWLVTYKGKKRRGKWFTGENLQENGREQESLSWDSLKILRVSSI